MNTSARLHRSPLRSLPLHIHGPILPKGGKSSIAHTVSGQPVCRENSTNYYFAFHNADELRPSGGPLNPLTSIKDSA